MCTLHKKPQPYLAQLTPIPLHANRGVDPGGRGGGGRGQSPPPPPNENIGGGKHIVMQE